MKLTMSEARQMQANTDELLDKLTRQKMAEDRSLQYYQALKLVASERPDLDRDRTTAMRLLCVG